MKKLIFMLLVVFAFVANADAQGWLGRLKDKAVDAAKRTVENNVERKVEKEVDDAMNGKSSKKGGKSSRKASVCQSILRSVSTVDAKIPTATFICRERSKTSA